MDVLIRVLAVFVEVVILVVIILTLLSGVWLTVFDLGLASKYKKVIAMALVVAGSLVVLFFIAHLTAFYPVT